MLGSTQLSASIHENSTAGAYQLFTGTGVECFDRFEASYIDVKGDGVFALFNGNQPYRALAAAVTFKTFAKEEFVPRIKDVTGLTVGCHIGIDEKLVLVRKLGLKRYAERSDRQNEVWAGKTNESVVIPWLPPGHPFLNVQASFYWSARTAADNPILAWVVDFTGVA
jgi:hypothetical protein